MQGVAFDHPPESVLKVFPLTCTPVPVHPTRLADHLARIDLEELADEPADEVEEDAEATRAPPVDSTGLEPVSKFRVRVF